MMRRARPRVALRRSPWATVALCTLGVAYVVHSLQAWVVRESPQRPCSGWAVLPRQTFPHCKLHRGQWRLSSGTIPSTIPVSSARKANTLVFGARTRLSGASDSAKHDAQPEGLDIDKFVRSLQRTSLFEDLIDSLTPNFPVEDISNVVEQHARAIGDWNEPNVQLTGSCLRETHTLDSDVDFLLDTKGARILPHEWDAFIKSLGSNQNISLGRDGEKAIEFELWGVPVSVVAKDRGVDTDLAPMPLLQGDGDKAAASRGDVHRMLMSCYGNYSGSRNVVKALKMFLQFKGFVLEALVKRAARLPQNWNNRAKDRSGVVLMQYVLNMFRLYPKYDPQSPLDYLFKSASAMGQDEQKWNLEEAKRNCAEARDFAERVFRLQEQGTAFKQGSSQAINSQPQTNDTSDASSSMPLDQATLHKDKPILRDVLPADARPLFVVLGETGSGKTSCLKACTSGEEACGGDLRIGGKISSETNTPVLIETASGRFLDSPGVGDTEGRDDTHMVALAKKVCQIGKVNLFCLVLNGQQPRLDKSLVQMMRLFENMFGTGMWSNVALLFTRWSQDTFGDYPGNETVKKQEWNNKLREEFPAIGSKEIPCFFVDSNALLDNRFFEKRKDVYWQNYERFRDLMLLARSKSPFRTSAAQHQTTEDSDAARYLQDLGLHHLVAKVLHERIFDRESLLQVSDADLHTLGFNGGEVRKLRGKGGNEHRQPQRLRTIEDTPEALRDELRQAEIPFAPFLDWSMVTALRVSDQDLANRLPKLGDRIRFRKWRAQRLASHKVTSELAWLGARVQRHVLDWIWDRTGCCEQDGGEGGHGTIVGLHAIGGSPQGRVLAPHAGWATVSWLATGITESYRIGFDNKLDLVFAAGQAPGEDVTDIEELSPVHLRPDFPYLTGSTRPYVSLFDIRPEVCRRVGGFLHGDVVSLAVMGQTLRAVCIGVKSHGHENTDDDDPHLALWFHFDDQQGAMLCDIDASSLKYCGSTTVSKSDGDVFIDNSIGTAPNHILDEVRRNLQPNFSYQCGLGAPIVRMFDVRDDIVEKLWPGHKSGDLIRILGSSDEHVVIGVRIPEMDQLPRLWLHSSTESGAAIVLIGPQGTSRAGRTCLNEARPEDFEFRHHEESRDKLRDIASTLKPTVQFPAGQVLSEMKMFDVREDIVKKVSGGFVSGEVLYLNKHKLVVVGVREDNKGLARVWFWMEGSTGAGYIDLELYGPAMACATSTGEIMDLEELKHTYAKYTVSDSEARPRLDVAIRGAYPEV